MNVTNQILVFVKFLNLNYKLINNQLQTNEHLDEYEIEVLLNNWFQFNWEILVERSICSDEEFIEYYNEGADVFDESYRITHQNVEPTHKIICKSISKNPLIDVLSGKVIDLKENDFICFVNFDGMQYSFGSEFNFGLFEDEEGVFSVIDIKHLTFHKIKL
jgi:hypothetical protein